VLIAAAAGVSILFCLLFYKEFTLVCFDADYGATQGWPVARLDFLMMSLVIVVTVIGLQAVGLILVVALLIIPAAAARFWTFSLRHMLWLAAFFGGLSGLMGSAISALMANLPAGAVIVLTASVLFVFSMIFGAKRGVLRLVLDRLKLSRRIFEENLLRDLYEWFEVGAGDEKPPPASLTGQRQGPRLSDLRNRRAWKPAQLARTVRRLQAAGRLVTSENGRLHFSAEGMKSARDVVRKHRLWEAYLISHADVAAGMVDLSADRIEHVLDEDIIHRLEQLFPETAPRDLPQSPHRLASPAEGV
jgi:manganese/zinc/iron transport system permease protein